MISFLKRSVNGYSPLREDHDLERPASPRAAQMHGLTSPFLSDRINQARPQNPNFVQPSPAKPVTIQSNLRVDENNHLKGISSGARLYLNGRVMPGTTTLTRGDIVRFAFAGENGTVDGQCYYLANGRLNEMTPAHARLVEKLFPSGIARTHFKQGKLRDCFFLAALRATAVTQPEAIVQLVHPPIDAEKTVKIRFLNKRSEPIGEMSDIDFKYEGVRGDLGVRLIETAFLRSKKSLERDLSVESYKTGATLDIGLRDLHPNRRITRIRNNRGLGNSEPTRSQTTRLLKRIATQPTKVSATIGSVVAPQLHGLAPHHAYAITEVDPQAHALHIENPHDTRKQLRISYDTLFNDFAEIGAAEPHPPKRFGINRENSMPSGLGAIPLPKDSALSQMSDKRRVLSQISENGRAFSLISENGRALALSVENARTRAQVGEDASSRSQVRNNKRAFLQISQNGHAISQMGDTRHAHSQINENEHALLQIGDTDRALSQISENGRGIKRQRIT